MAAKLMEFFYQELAKATNNFSSDNKIGQGRFGAVYFAKLRCQKAAIKNMDVQASTEFLSELMVLKHDHHLNLVTMLVTLFQGVNLWHGQQGCKLLWIQQEDLNIYMNTLFLFISTVM
ncbi:lysM domain receptor-like kinase 3 [Arachis hypogaea]|uniref:lysM domain receptor-like kinase 3 n=1 Tax=Arachis hypogaea TaxID=3818 RepID=UPI003B2288E4